MSLNGLTGSAGLKLGPLVLETLVKHYFERHKATQKVPDATPDGIAHDEKQGGSTLNDNLRQEELLYDQAFTIVKKFLSTSSRHTVEELQQFSNTRTPSPPWVRVLRVVVPMSCCDQAAEYLIDALGGESAVKRIVGGTKWWQIRGINGVDGEWIVARKDWQEAKKRAKSMERREKERGTSAQRSTTPDSAPMEDTSDPGYTPDMDEQRCILYLHGGGYYFGSVDQERYSIQRFARKINGRVFAINYRLSPQYPFPCAIQDALAAYLYLIQPPPEAKHKPVKPQHIVIMGDSAGGGLSLATLQVIRDSGLPPCAGGVLISPWCDMNHSFPSIHTNTETDVIPYYGLSMHKPSILWPPPTNVESDEVRQSIRSRLRKVAGLSDQGRLKSFLGSRGRAPLLKDEPIIPEQVADVGRRMDLGDSTSAPSIIEGQDQRIVLEVEGGEPLVVDSQIQLYAPNDLLSHPLISHCGAYLGGLPPLFFIAGDQEVLRDEIIYTAHRAANPSKFPIPVAAKRLYPKITETAAKYPTPTKVHLQVYDGCAHVLPILFAFTTPAKYCFRAIASFCRFVTGMQAFGPGQPSPATANGPGSPQHRSFFGGPLFTSPPEEVGDPLAESRRRSWWGGERASPLSRRATWSEKKSGKEKQRSNKEQKEKSKGESQDERGQVEKMEVRVEATGEGAKEEVRKGAVESPGPGKAERDTTKAEVVGKVEVVGNGSLPVEGKTGKVRMTDERLKAKAAEETQTEGDTARPLREAKSIRSLNSDKSTKESQGNTKPGKKRWSLRIVRRPTLEQVPMPSKKLTEDVAGPRFRAVKEPEGARCAGDYPPIYDDCFEETNFVRERVSIRGVIRLLEPEAELPAFQLQPDLVGAIPELSLRRYVQGKAKYDDKFSGTFKSVDKERKRNLKSARKEGDKSMGHLDSYLKKVTEKSDSGINVLDSPRLQKVTAGSWNWSWALDEGEHPPPSSIVSRRDTWEARKLAMIADIMPEKVFSGNNLWQHLVTFLTVTPDKKTKTPAEREHPKPEAGEQIESSWTNVSTSSEIDAQVKATAKDIPPAQTNGTTSLPKPSDLGSTNTRPRGWYWTRGSLWKEKFRANHSSKTHKRVPTSASTVTPAPRTPGSTLARP
ncbi:alpha/beta-hydrolase [Thelephora ganbajun]|uniref:Alpha/beta-hydrolase n=1 Tax=Thelephora ganbajun TaxID=370292 RepID=A0ACB6Z8W8_THEGA|nr:alpha/beta-hydrolase [Thelephora ganbajun]